jgi:hypothetical protein
MGSVETHGGPVGMRKQPQNCRQNVVFNALAILRLSIYCLWHRGRSVSCSAARLFPGRGACRCGQTLRAVHGPSRRSYYQAQNARSNSFDGVLICHIVFHAVFCLRSCSAAGYGRAGAPFCPRPLDRYAGSEAEAGRSQEEPFAFHQDNDVVVSM